MEVLKAIQKAKEVKSKLNNSEKKVGLCVGGDRSDGEEPDRAVEHSGPLCPGRTPPCPGCLTLGKHPPLCSPLLEAGGGGSCHAGLCGLGGTAFTITTLVRAGSSFLLPWS